MIRRFVLLMAVLLVPAAARAQVVTWTIDPGHTSTQFAVRHMVVATVRGVFDGPTGTVAFDPKDIPGTLKVDATFNTKSIDTNNAERDADLRSEQFLNVAKFPTMKFLSKRTEPGGPGRFKVTGDLTLRGVTHEVVLDVEGPTEAVKDLDGRLRSGAAMTTTINRKLWGLQYNVLLEAGGAVVADEVKVQIHYASGGHASRFRSRAVTGFELTTVERADLLAFLNSLTDDGFLEDPAFGRPR